MIREEDGQLGESSVIDTKVNFKEGEWMAEPHATGRSNETRMYTVTKFDNLKIN